MSEPHVSAYMLSTSTPHQTALSTTTSLLSFPDEVLQKLFVNLGINVITMGNIKQARHGFALALTNTRLMRVFCSTIETLSVEEARSDCRVTRSPHLRKVMSLAGRSLKTLHAPFQGDIAQNVLQGVLQYCPNVTNLSFFCDAGDIELPRRLINTLQLNSLRVIEASYPTMKTLAFLSAFPKTLELVRLSIFDCHAVSALLENSAAINSLTVLKLGFFHNLNLVGEPLQNLVSSICRLGRNKLEKLNFSIQNNILDPNVRPKPCREFLDECGSLIDQVRQQAITCLKAVKLQTSAKAAKYVFALLSIVSCDARLEISHHGKAHVSTAVDCIPGKPLQLIRTSLEPDWFLATGPPDFSHLQHLCTQNDTVIRHGDASLRAYLTGTKDLVLNALSSANCLKSLCAHSSHRDFLTGSNETIPFVLDMLSRLQVTRLEADIDIFLDLEGDGPEQLKMIFRGLRVIYLRWDLPLTYCGCNPFSKVVKTVHWLLSLLDGGSLERLIVNFEVNLIMQFATPYLRRYIEDTLKAVDHFEKNGGDAWTVRAQLESWRASMEDVQKGSDSECGVDEMQLGSQEEDNSFDH